MTTDKKRRRHRAVKVVKLIPYAGQEKNTRQARRKAGGGERDRSPRGSRLKMYEKMLKEIE